MFYSNKAAKQGDDVFDQNNKETDVSLPKFQNAVSGLVSPRNETESGAETARTLLPRQ